MPTLHMQVYFTDCIHFKVQMSEIVALQKRSTRSNQIKLFI